MRVQVTLLLILAISTVGFVIMDIILFSEAANVGPALFLSLSLSHTHTHTHSLSLGERLGTCAVRSGRPRSTNNVTCISLSGLAFFFFITLEPGVE